jgi:capsule polysaccharide modification protein KpsS
MPGLTYQGDLDAFWTDSYHSQIDVKLYASFISYLVGMTQVNGSFYRKLSLVPNKTGIIWSEMLDKAA